MTHKHGRAFVANCSNARLPSQTAGHAHARRDHSHHQRRLEWSAYACWNAMRYLAALKMPDIIAKMKLQGLHTLSSTPVEFASPSLARSTIGPRLSP